MRLSTLVNLGLVAVGAAASLPILRRRRNWERANRRAYIVLDYDDALAVSTRTGITLGDFLHEAKHHGATHVSLPELTLDRLLSLGRIAPVVPAQPLQPAPGVGPWICLAGGDAALLSHLAAELAARVPASQAQLVPGRSQPTIAVAGNRPALAEIGLGFEAAAAAEARAAGLELAPRPVSFSWPEGRLVARTLRQAAELPADLVAFDGDLILGHEMHLDATVDGLLAHNLKYAYFCETRHQKGDWFIAKRLAGQGQVVPAHFFSPAALVPEDFHSAAHHWGMLARARGIRLCYVNVFRRLHATDPLECLHYIEHIKEELEEIGLRFAGAPAPALPAPARPALAQIALAPAGAAALAASSVLGLPEPAALSVTVLAAAGAVAMPYLDRPRGRLEATYPPSYAPKLLALAGAAAAPAAAALSGNLAQAALLQAGTAASLAALTTGLDYQLRIEAFRSLNLDWALPLAAVLLKHGGRGRWWALFGLGIGWASIRRRNPDILLSLDRDLPSGHTHHLSAAQRLMGDTFIALGPRPGRKWAGLGLAGLAAAALFQRLGRRNLALASALAGTAGNMLMLAAFRQPERPLEQTLPAVGRSWAGWSPVAVALAVASLFGRD